MVEIHIADAFLWRTERISKLLCIHCFMWM